MSDSDDARKGAKPDYQIGYGRPPVETRFKKGQLQNFQRRRKGNQSDQGTLAKLANEQISITENGTSERFPPRKRFCVA
jgi:hypothetical protein